MEKRRWSVTVEVEGDRVLTLGTEDMSGIQNVEDFRKEITEAANHLLAFIGTGEESFLPDNTQ